MVSFDFCGSLYPSLWSLHHGCLLVHGINVFRQSATIALRFIKNIEHRNYEKPVIGAEGWPLGNRRGFSAPQTSTIQTRYASRAYPEWPFFELKTWHSSCIVPHQEAVVPCNARSAD